MILIVSHISCKNDLPEECSSYRVTQVNYEKPYGNNYYEKYEYDIDGRVLKLSCNKGEDGYIKYYEYNDGKLVKVITNDNMIKPEEGEIVIKDTLIYDSNGFLIEKENNHIDLETGWWVSFSTYYYYNDKEQLSRTDHYNNQFYTLTSYQQYYWADENIVHVVYYKPDGEIEFEYLNEFDEMPNYRLVIQNGYWPHQNLSKNNLISHKYIEHYTRPLFDCNPCAFEMEYNECELVEKMTFEYRTERIEYEYY